VNLERPVTLAARLGGHLVQGHVDGVGEITDVRRATQDGGSLIRVRLAEDLLRYVVNKGSITVDGISLTVAGMHDDGVTIAVVPHTLAVTTRRSRTSPRGGSCWSSTTPIVRTRATSSWRRRNARRRP
jgi:riboflavin synthase